MVRHNGFITNKTNFERSQGPEMCQGSELSFKNKSQLEPTSMMFHYRDFFEKVVSSKGVRAPKYVKAPNLVKASKIRARLKERV